MYMYVLDHFLCRVQYPTGQVGGQEVDFLFTMLIHVHNVCMCTHTCNLIVLYSTFKKRSNLIIWQQVGNPMITQEANNDILCGRLLPGLRHIYTHAYCNFKLKLTVKRSHLLSISTRVYMYMYVTFTSICVNSFDII